MCALGACRKRKECVDKAVTTSKCEQASYGGVGTQHQHTTFKIAEAVAKGGETNEKLMFLHSVTNFSILISSINTEFAASF